MVDRRIVPDLRWLAERFPIYVTDGYSGPLPEGGGRAGCNGCHTRNSDHHNGLAVDIVPNGGGTKCDRSWLPIIEARRLGRAAPGQAPPALPLGRLRRRRRPRLREPPAPLLEPRGGGRVHAGRMGRSPADRAPRRDHAAARPSSLRPRRPSRPARVRREASRRSQTGGVAPRRDRVARPGLRRYRD